MRFSSLISERSARFHEAIRPLEAAGWFRRVRPWSEEQVERGIASGIECLEYRIRGKR